MASQLACDAINTVMQKLSLFDCDHWNISQLQRLQNEVRNRIAERLAAKEQLPIREGRTQESLIVERKKLVEIECALLDQNIHMCDYHKINNLVHTLRYLDLNIFLTNPENYVSRVKFKLYLRVI
jgi:hypothetical protein